MSMAIYVFFGGGVGALLRYAMSLFGKSVGWTYPWATLSVNMVGACAIGLLAGWFSQGVDWSPELKAGVLVGVLGGLTTFSTYSLEALELLRAGHVAQGLGYVALSNVLALGFCWIGFRGVGA